MFGDSLRTKMSISPILFAGTIVISGEHRQGRDGIGVARIRHPARNNVKCRRRRIIHA